MTPEALQQFANALIPHDRPTMVTFASVAGINMDLHTMGVFIRDGQQVDPTIPHGTTAIVLEDQVWGHRLDDPLRSLQEVTAHELAHHCDLGFHSTPAAVWRSFKRAIAAPQQIITDSPPWLPSHGRRFVRACCHLVHRAERLGVVLDADEVLGIRNLWPGFSRGEAFADALGSEPTNNVDDCLHDVLDTGEPTAFTDLWNSDVTRWRNDNADLNVA